MVLDFIAEEDSKIPFSKDRVILPPWKDCVGDKKRLEQPQ